MFNPVCRFLPGRGAIVALGWTLTVMAGASLGSCAIDDRPVRARTASGGDGGEAQTSNAGQAGAPFSCEGQSCVGVNTQRPLGSGCLSECPGDDACRSFADVPSGTGSDAGCIRVDDCRFTWKPAARDGEACRCDASGCSLLLGEACSASAACAAGSCVATAAGTSVCCAQACDETEVCAPDGSACTAAEPCSGEARRCSGPLHQSCVDGAWRTLTDCGALGCSTQLDSCLRSAGQTCDTDDDCGEGRCLETAEGNRVCCTGPCDTSCQRCSAEGTECVSVDDDDACGTIECPADSCRVYDPATVVTNRCADGQCAAPERACAVFQPQRADLECSATALCDAEGNCARPKRELLSECSFNEQCASGACVATAAGTSVCCQPCAANEVCGPTGACVPAPVCAAGTTQCSGPNFQRCVGGQWVTELACAALGCSVVRQGCFASAGQACNGDADCGEGTCQEAAGGGSVCCTAACDGPCRVCAASGTVCTNLPDDAECGPISCPQDTTCRDFPASVSAQRCVAGRCGDATQLCQGNARNVGQACSLTNLCDEAGNCSDPKKGNGEVCGSASECASNACVDGVCCNSACNGVCETCENSGICRAATTDTACGLVSCSSFDAECVTDRTNTDDACNGRGQCRTTDDCGFRSSNTRCGQGGLCDGRGTCQGPSVECGVETCSAGNVCCSMLDFATGQRTVTCGVGEECTFPGDGAGPIIRVSCDQNADCVGNEVCCMVTNNVNSGEITCRSDCTAEAVGAELGAPPEMLVVGQLCASEVGQLVLQCPSGQTCRPVVDTLPPDYRACRP
jgi:hypothetical protein